MQKPKKLEFTIKSMFERQDTANIVHPNAARKSGSTRHYPYYDIDKQKSMNAFCEHLQTFDGGRKTSCEARQVARDVSKYLAFADKKFSWKHLLDNKKQKQYILKLESDNIGVDGICTKIDRIIQALAFTDLPFEQKKQSEEQLKKWKRSFVKEKHPKQIEREMSYKTPTSCLQNAQSLFKSDAIATFLHDCMQQKQLTISQHNHFVTYILMALVYKNWQRPGSAIYMKVEEAEKAEIKDEKLIIHARLEL